MNDIEFHREQISLLSGFNDRLQKASATPEGEPLAPLAEQFSALLASPEHILDDAPATVARMFTTAPQLAEHFPRETLWYLGGECLHFMPDDEIERYAALDQQRRDALDNNREFDWREARATVLKLQ